MNQNEFYRTLVVVESKQDDDSFIVKVPGWNHRLPIKLTVHQIDNPAVSDRLTNELLVNDVAYVFASVTIGLKDEDILNMKFKDFE